MSYSNVCKKVNPQHLLKGKSIQHLAGTGKPRRPPPQGYQCKACGAAGDKRHWIFECPKKISKKRGASGTASVSVNHKLVNERKQQEMTEKKRRKLDPGANPNKVFVSGLPFGVTQDVVLETFESCGTISKIQLLYFPGRRFKCKGQCFVTFTSSAAATFAVQRVNGKTMKGEDGKTRYLEVVHSRSRSLNKVAAATERTAEHISDGNNGGKGQATTDASQDSPGNKIENIEKSDNINSDEIGVEKRSTEDDRETEKKKKKKEKKKKEKKKKKKKEKKEKNEKEIEIQESHDIVTEPVPVKVVKTAEKTPTEKREKKAKKEKKKKEKKKKEKKEKKEKKAKDKKKIRET